MNRTDLEADGWTLAGQVPVDAGCVLISDPCYVLPYAAHNDKGMDYGVLVDNRPMDWYSTPVVDLEKEGGAFGSTLLQRFGGDGVFPLYAKIGADGMLQSVMIDFSPDEPEGDDDL